MKTLESHSGFTIIEAAMSVAIVSILLTTSMAAMSAIAKSRAVQAERRAAYALNEQLMVEILSQYFQNPAKSTFGPSTGETRQNFNGVDDYNGYGESPPGQKSGVILTDYANWSRSVSVVSVDPNNPANALSNSTLKQITVTATAPSGKQYVLTGLRSQYGPYEVAPQVQTTFLTWVGVDLQAGGQVKNMRLAGRPLNVTNTQP